MEAHAARRMRNTPLTADEDRPLGQLTDRREQRQHVER